MPRIWGYVRASDESKQKDSPEKQIEYITRKAVALSEAGDGDFDPTPIDQGERYRSPSQIKMEYGSASKIRYNERAGFKWLMENMQPGDTLIVWALSRIDRNPFPLMRAVEFLVKRNIRLISLSDFGGMEMDFNGVLGQTMLMVIAMVNNLWREFHSQNAREMAAYAKARELPAGSKHYWGLKKVHEPVGNSGKSKAKMVIDYTEIANIIEILHRRHNGEAFEAIARDFYRRNVRKANGGPWSKFDVRHGKKRQNSSQVRSAYKWAVEQLAQHGTLRGVAVPVELWPSESKAPGVAVPF